MPLLPHGLYESLVTEALAERLDRLPEDRRKHSDELRTAEAADRIAWHVAAVVERAIDMLPEAERADAGVALARTLVDTIVGATDDAPASIMVMLIEGQDANDPCATPST